MTFPKDDSYSIEPGSTLGGPILRDRRWFFAGHTPRVEPIRRTAPLADGTTRTLRQYLKTDNAVANVTGPLGSQWRFRASYNLGRVLQEGLLHGAQRHERRKRGVRQHVDPAGLGALCERGLVPPNARAA